VSTYPVTVTEMLRVLLEHLGIAIHLAAVVYREHAECQSEDDTREDEPEQTASETPVGSHGEPHVQFAVPRL
jgi:hypothetical protein